MNKIPIAAIDRLRFNLDGNGIRTLVATQGCPLRCKMCINPHTQDAAGKSRLLSPQELYDEIAIDRLYFAASGGGLTIGGGEPLLHSKGVAEFAGMVHGEIELGIETSLNVPLKNVEDVAGLFDFYYVDIKSMDPEIYRKYTGGQLNRALENLKWLLEAEGPEKITVRIPIIKDDADAHSQEESRKAVEALGVKKDDLFTYI